MQIIASCASCIAKSNWLSTILAPATVRSHGEKLHPDVLKIDQSFTTAIGTDAVNSTVTDIIIALGQRLNELVAEGGRNGGAGALLTPTVFILCRGISMRGRCPLRIFHNGWRKFPPAHHNRHIIAP